MGSRSPEKGQSCQEEGEGSCLCQKKGAKEQNQRDAIYCDGRFGWGFYMRRMMELQGGDGVSKVCFLKKVEVLCQEGRTWVWYDRLEKRKSEITAVESLIVDL